jgi:uncharacterized DUF497 family protein
MQISEIVWLQKILDKISIKHRLTGEEVEEVFGNKPRYRFIESGEVEDEHVYSALGRTDAGRYVTVIFILKAHRRALIITARDMDRKERKLYGG